MIAVLDAAVPTIGNKATETCKVGYLRSTTVILQENSDRQMFVNSNGCIPVKNTLDWSGFISGEGELILLCDIEFSVVFFWLELCIDSTLRSLQTQYLRDGDQWEVIRDHQLRCQDQSCTPE